MSEKIKTKKPVVIESSSNESEEIPDVDYDLKTQFEKIGDCDDENYYSNDCNKFLLKKELTEGEYKGGIKLDYEIKPPMAHSERTIFFKFPKKLF